MPRPVPSSVDKEGIGTGSRFLKATFWSLLRDRSVEGNSACMLLEQVLKVVCIPDPEVLQVLHVRRDPRAAP
ncbi:MAG: hypothetical protein WD651_04120 [Acidimicrobiia bacterium]